MKWTLLAAAALVLCCGLPFRTHETRTLLPVQTVQAERTEAGVRIVTEAGETLGRHDGLMYYTLGQRRGLGIGGQKGGDGGRWFVIEKDLQRNRLVVAQGEDSPKLYTTHCRASQATWIAGEAPAKSFDCTAKYRYRQPDQRVHVETDGNGGLLVTAYEPQRAVTPGQSVVLYDGEVCLGGAIADETWNG